MPREFMYVIDYVVLIHSSGQTQRAEDEKSCSFWGQMLGVRESDKIRQMLPTLL